MDMYMCRKMSDKRIIKIFLSIESLDGDVRKDVIKSKHIPIKKWDVRLLIHAYEQVVKYLINKKEEPCFDEYEEWIDEYESLPRYNESKFTSGDDWNVSESANDNMFKLLPRYNKGIFISGDDWNVSESAHNSLFKLLSRYNVKLTMDDWNNLELLYSSMFDERNLHPYNSIMNPPHYDHMKSIKSLSSWDIIYSKDPKFDKMFERCNEIPHVDRSLIEAMNRMWINLDYFDIVLPRVI